MKIRLINFRCYADSTFDFGDDGLVLISACSGAGKSTILMAIHFALYGVGFKLPMNGKKSCKVEFEYENMFIKRSKVPNKLELTINDQDYEDDTAQEIINSKFGDAFDVTGYIEQDASNSFIKMSPTEKLEFLEKFAFKNVHLSDIKERCNSLKKQRGDILSKTTTQLEMSTKVFEELIKPEEVEFPIKCGKKMDYEKVLKNEEVRKKNSEILIKRSRVQLDKLNKELTDLRVLETFLQSRDESIESLTNKLYNISINEKDVEFEGDDNLEEYKRQLESILARKKLSILEETYNVDKEKLNKMKEAEKQKMQKELDDICNNLWVEYTEEELISTKKDTKEALADAKRVSFLKKEIKDFENINENDIQINKELLEKKRIDLDNNRQILENIKKQKLLYSCPSCNNKLHFRENKLILSDNINIDSSVNIDNVKKEIQVIQESIKKLETDIPDKENKLSRFLKVKKEIDTILSSYEELNEESLLEDLEYLESYHKDELAKIKRKNTLENSLNKNVFSTYDVFENDLLKLETRIKKLRETCDEDESEFEEEELRKIIIREENNRDALNKILKERTSIENEKKKFQKQILEKKESHLNLYKSAKTQNDLESEIETEKNTIIDLENKKNEHILNLENIKKYNDYIREKENYTNWEIKVKNLQEQELEDRRKYTAVSLLKEKILEAESIAVANIIDSINMHAQIYLDAFFVENPIIVRLLSFKETKKASKPQINLEIQYKEMECDLKSLSGGEVSRVVLAFALALSEMFNTPFILLDESTANLNQELTITVFDAIKENFKGKMVIIVAHQVVKGVFDKVIEIE
jgi:exonuclease SbcC